MSPLLAMPVISFATGLLLSFGLVISGMTTPSKVIGFLDVASGWDPSLGLVMVGAILVHALAFRLITRRTSPIFDAKFAIPTRKDIDAPLLVGAAIFGVGWAIGGVCPGPGIVSAASGSGEGLVFLVSMFAGMSIFKIYEAARASA
jgi:uncharacterized membrane protein YedE/YeeE